MTTRVFIENGQVYPGSPPPKEVSNRKPDHEGSSFGVVWVNDIGRDAMTSDKPEKFPAGSVIVREKFATREAAHPEVLAIMIKHPKGFSRVSGDWEYVIVDGGLTKVREREKKGSCNSCHLQQKDRDFVFPVTSTK